MKKLRSDPRVAQALQLLHDRDAEITELQVRYAEIPAPDSLATRRGDQLAHDFEAAGLRDVHRDAAGNVLGMLPGSEPTERAVILSAHLDTVFPGLDSIRVERRGTILRAPGVSDDAAGLASMVHLARALHDAHVVLRRDIVFVGTVGEEGEGDLRGVKQLFQHDMPPARVHAFLSLDLGANQEIVNEGLGSRRLHVTVRGPGGHSWGDFGRPNPIHALARAIDGFLEMPLPSGPRSSYNVGTIQGGQGVNVIPEEASLRMDLRSESPEVLSQLESAFRAAIRDGLQREQNWSRGDSSLSVQIDVIGDRPVGLTRPEAPVIRTFVAAFASQGLPVTLGSSSTDANLPMSLGVPALALPHGAISHDVHSHTEWCDVGGRTPVLQAELLGLVSLAELGTGGAPRPQRSPTD